MKNASDELKRSFGAVLKSIFELDFNIHVKYLDLLISLYKQENSGELWILECLLDCHLFDQYIVEDLEGYEDTAIFSQLSIIKTLGTMYHGDFREAFIKAHLEQLSINN
jgi:hypothetical protein